MRNGAAFSGEGPPRATVLFVGLGLPQLLSRRKLMTRDPQWTIALPVGEDGMIGRVCPSCDQYFRLKPGTGLPTRVCNCPYCGFQGDSSEFTTPEQWEYARSVALRKAQDWIGKEIKRRFGPLSRRTRNSFIKLQVNYKPSHIPIRYYKEDELQTVIVCEECGLEFAVFDVFSRCPDCTRMTAMAMFANSLKHVRKHLALRLRIPAEDTEYLAEHLASTLSRLVAAFDALGKKLRHEFKDLLPDRPRNLFQNLDALDDVIQQLLGLHLRDLLKAGEYEKAYLLFQVRHLWEHNFGEIDDDFIRKTGCDPALLRTKYVVDPDDIQSGIDIIETLGKELYSQLSELKRPGVSA